ncbi:MAG: hypothetical protein KJ732_07980, partial [Candidatus Margulisbacteria bacterium]|nr:hypothetical protein [Candidatus Margulisiibacteriota bacterium]
MRLPDAYQTLCRGVQIHPEAAGVFVRAAIEAGLGSSLQIAEGMRYFELEAILKDPAKLSLALEIDKHESVVRITFPKTKETLVAELQETFAKNHDKGMALLQNLKDLLAAPDYEYCFRETVFAALKGFGSERHKADDFEFLLQELVQIGDHELNQKIIAELKDAEAHDVVWVMWALIELRQAFPKEIQYHREYGDLNFQWKIYDEAMVGYRAALELAPEPAETKPVKPSQPLPKTKAARKRRVVSGSRKTHSVKTQAPQTLTAKLIEAEKLLAKSLRQRNAELIEQVKSGWRALKPGQREEARGLIDAIFILGLDSFEQCYKVLSESPRSRLAKLDYLQDLCLEDGLEKRAEYFQFLGDKLVGQIYDNAIRGRSFNHEQLEPVNVRELGFQLVNTIFRMPESIALVIGLLKENLIEEIASSLITRLGQAVEKLAANKNPKLQDVARYMLVDFTLAKVVREYPANAAELYAMGGIKLANDGKYDGAKVALNKALAADPGCVLALEKLAVIANNEADYPTAMGFAQQIIGKSATPAGLFDPQRPKIAYAGMVMDSSAGRLLDSARLHFGFAAMQLYEETQQADLLKKTITALEPLIAQGNALGIAEVLLVKAYFYSEQYDKGLAATLGYWSRLNPGDSASRDFFEFVNDQSLNYFRSQVDYDRELEVDLVNHGIYLLEYGAAALAQPIFDFFRREENRGTDSYYYAQYGYALAAYRDGDYETCRQRLRVIIEADDVRLRIHSDELHADSPVKANAHSLRIQTYRGQ